jgi:hypothetical protein
MHDHCRQLFHVWAWLVILPLPQFRLSDYHHDCVPLLLFLQGSQEWRRRRRYVCEITQVGLVYGRLLTPKLHLAFLRYIVLSNLYILHYDLYILHSDMYILLSDLYILHSDFYMLLSYMHIMHSVVCVLLNCMLISLFNDQLLFSCWSGILIQ